MTAMHNGAGKNRDNNSLAAIEGGNYVVRLLDLGTSLQAIIQTCIDCGSIKAEDTLEIIEQEGRNYRIRANSRAVGALTRLSELLIIVPENVFTTPE